MDRISIAINYMLYFLYGLEQNTLLPTLLCLVSNIVDDILTVCRKKTKAETRVEENLSYTPYQLIKLCDLTSSPPFSFIYSFHTSEREIAKKN